MIEEWLRARGFVLTEEGGRWTAIRGSTAWADERR